MKAVDRVLLALTAFVFSCCTPMKRIPSRVPAPVRTGLAIWSFDTADPNWRQNSACVPVRPRWRLRQDRAIPSGLQDASAEAWVDLGALLAGMEREHRSAVLGQVKSSEVIVG